ncbi:MAG: glycosyltransferase family 4 protein [Armatimonadetes bacterium]|nr:glycosyltransferase family 4 protein [Armatimonadota bacterium]
MVLADLARELVTLGHEIDVVTAAYGDLPEREHVGGVAIHRISCGRKSRIAPSVPELLGYVRRAPAHALGLMRARRYDLIYGTCILPGGLVARQLHQATGLPYMLTTSGSDVPGHNPRKFGLAHRLTRPLWRRIIRDAAAVTCQSEYLAERIRAAYGGPVQNLQIIPNGIDPESIRPRPLEAREKRILAVGRIEEAKGYQYLIEAMVGLDCDYRLEIVGDGPYLPVLRDLAERLGVPVVFHGWLDKSNGALRDLYETSSIFVHPSLAEAFGVVVLEAMLAGLPVVVADGTGSAELVGASGLKVPPASVGALHSALERLLHDPVMCSHLGKTARQSAEDMYAWRHVAQRYQDAMVRHSDNA